MKQHRDRREVFRSVAIEIGQLVVMIGYFEILRATESRGILQNAGFVVIAALFGAIRFREQALKEARRVRGILEMAHRARGVAS